MILFKISFQIILVVNFFQNLYSSKCVVPKEAGFEVFWAAHSISGFKDFMFSRIQLDKPCQKGAKNLPAVLELANGTHLKNVIIGKNGGSGIICKGQCTLENVHWENVCGETAATMLSNNPKHVFKVIGGSASYASNVFTHKGKSNKMIIKGFCAFEINSLVTSAPSPFTDRVFKIRDVKISKLNNSVINLRLNQGDNVTMLKNIKVDDASQQATICKLYNQSNDGELDPIFIKNGDGNDNTCMYKSDVQIKVNEKIYEKTDL